jgi:hypothetical protein
MTVSSVHRLAAERRRFGCRRLHLLLRREGIELNHKKLFRIYREERLTVRRRGGRKRALSTRAPMTLPQEANQRWSLDFVSDVRNRQRRCAEVLEGRALSSLMPLLSPVAAYGGGGLVGELEIIGRRMGAQLRDRTAEPNELCAQLHNRMPEILAPEPWPTWLGEEPADEVKLKSLLTPYPSEGMICWPVSTRVGNVKNNDPSLIEPVVLP